MYGVEYAWNLIIFNMVMSFSLTTPLIVPFGELKGGGREGRGGEGREGGWVGVWVGGEGGRGREGGRVSGWGGREGRKGGRVGRKGGGWIGREEKKGGRERESCTSFSLSSGVVYFILNSISTTCIAPPLTMAASSCTAPLSTLS